jgi:hypothetical protein
MPKLAFVEVVFCCQEDGDGRQGNLQLVDDPAKVECDCHDTVSSFVTTSGSLCLPFSFSLVCCHAAIQALTIVDIAPGDMCSPFDWNDSIVCARRFMFFEGVNPV